MQQDRTKAAESVRHLRICQYFRLILADMNTVFNTTNTSNTVEYIADQQFLRQSLFTSKWCNSTSGRQIIGYMCLYRSLKERRVIHIFSSFHVRFFQQNALFSNKASGQFSLHSF